MIDKVKELITKILHDKVYSEALYVEQEARDNILAFHKNSPDRMRLAGVISGALRRQKRAVIKVLTDYLVKPECRSAFYCKKMQKETFGCSMDNTMLHFYYADKNRLPQDRAKTEDLDPKKVEIAKMVYKKMCPKKRS